jgi:8-oxo-dGTP diphosphatase
LHGPSTSPAPTVDAIIELPGGRVVLVRRKYPPLGWALPGGFVEIGETLEEAAIREAREETGLEIRLVEQLFTYSDPRRDTRRHTISTVFAARAEGEPKGADDAEQAEAFPLDALPQPIVFDHATILEDYRSYRSTGERRKLWP